VLWGADAEHFGPQLDPESTVVFLEQVKVDLYRDVPQIKFLHTSDMIINPDMEEGKKLFQYFRTNAGPQQMAMTSFVTMKRPRLTAEEVDAISEIRSLEV
jgi:hypothetical protein